MKAINYYINGQNFKTYGVHVSASKGIIGALTPKKRLISEWPDTNGEVIDRGPIYYEPRDISIDCILEADNRQDFIIKFNSFLQLFDGFDPKSTSHPHNINYGTQRLKIEIEPEKPLVYEIYRNKEVAASIKWNDSKNYGTFKLELREPEPVKRIYRFKQEAAALNIKIQSENPANIYLGDGNKHLDKTNYSTNHKYNIINNIYFIIITGDIYSTTTQIQTNATEIYYNNL